MADPSHLSLAVKILQRISTLEDGNLIEMDVKGTLNERVTLRFTPETLTPFVRLATQHLLQARSRRRAKSGHPGGAQALVAEAARSAAVPGGSKVTLSFLGQGLEFHFALDRTKAEALHAELGAAIADAKSQARQTRQ